MDGTDIVREADGLRTSASVITSKPAIHEQVKTGQWEAVRD